MITCRHTLLLIGSPKRNESNSFSLGNYLLDRLRAKGHETSIIFITRALKTEGRISEMLTAVDHADNIILATPLYIDCLPSPVIRSLEIIAEHRETSKSPKTQCLAVIMNCGFPEVYHNNTACAILRRFAGETGFEWSGCLKLGGGEIIGGKPLETRSIMLRNVIKALDVTAEALADGFPVPDEAVLLMAKRVVPDWLYMLVGTLRFKRLAKKHGVKNKITDKPYKEVPEEIL